MAVKWKFLKFGICKKSQWNFVYFWSMNYYGCMSLLFWKGRQSEMDFMLFMADCSLVKSLYCNRPEEWHCTSKLKSRATVTQSFSTSRSLLCTLTYKALSGTLPHALRLSHPLSVWIQQIVLHTSPRKKYYNFIREEVNFKQRVNKSP